MTTVDDVMALMKRCQRGVGGRNALDEAHSIMAECYGTLGALVAERDAWRMRFPQYIYRSQDDCVALRLVVDAARGQQ